MNVPLYLHPKGSSLWGLYLCKSKTIMAVIAFLSSAITPLPPSLFTLEIDCGIPTEVKHAQLAFNSTKMGSLAIYHCALGYILNSQNNPRLCLAKGIWSDPPECNGNLIHCIHMWGYICDKQRSVINREKSETSVFLSTSNNHFSFYFYFSALFCNN